MQLKVKLSVTLSLSIDSGFYFVVPENNMTSATAKFPYR
jgi:hypothetical protein